MSATSSAAANKGTLAPRIWERHTARSLTRWGRSGAVITVTGEVDAANAGDLAEHVQHCAAQCEWLVLDLGELEFMGTAGFAALRRIDTRCATHDVRWALVPGAAASRLLRICDPNAGLPAATSVGAALTQVQEPSLLQLVPQSR